MINRRTRESEVLETMLNSYVEGEAIQIDSDLAQNIRNKPFGFWKNKGAQGQG